MKTYLFTFIVSIFLLPAISMADASASLFDQIHQVDEILEIELVTDLDGLLTSVENMEYQPATVQFSTSAGHISSWNAKVKARGRYRYRICDFPPIKLNFKKGDLRDAGLAAFDTYKLVTHCFEDEAEARNNVLREFLAYRMYNKATHESFRVQLVKVTYKDDTNPEILEERWGILIENTKEMASRIGGEEVELLNQPEESFDSRAEQRMAVFQYLIGNTDYDVATNRNVKLVKIAETGKLVPVPYDFDFSFLVNANYAIPNGNVGQVFIKDRVYLGFERPEGETRYMDKYFQSLRHSFEELIRESDYVNRSNRVHLLNVLESFFEDQEVRGGIYVGASLAPVVSQPTTPSR